MQLEDRVYDYFISFVFLKILLVELVVDDASESATLSPAGGSSMSPCALITKTKGMNRKCVKM